MSHGRRASQNEAGNDRKDRGEGGRREDAEKQLSPDDVRELNCNDIDDEPSEIAEPLGKHDRDQRLPGDGPYGVQKAAIPSQTDQAGNAEE